MLMMSTTMNVILFQVRVTTFGMTFLIPNCDDNCLDPADKPRDDGFNEHELSSAKQTGQRQIHSLSSLLFIWFLKISPKVVFKGDSADFFFLVGVAEDAGFAVRLTFFAEALVSFAFREREIA